MANIKVSKADNSDKDISISKVDNCLTDLVKIFNKYKLNVKEILLTYGNLGYNLGAAIGGYKDKGPSVDELELLYATKPTVDVALMINSLQINLWGDDLNKTIENIKKENE